MGEWATLSVGRGEVKGDGTTSIEVLREVRFPHSLGMLSSTFPAFLGFEVDEGEYKVMGLASCGSPRFVDDVRKVVARMDDGAFALDMRYFDYHKTSERSLSLAFVALFGPPRKPHSPLDPTTESGGRYADIAASVSGG